MPTHPHLILLMTQLRMKYFAVILMFCLYPIIALPQQACFVNPFIGTSDDHGQTDPSASIPFGMVKPGPETLPRGNGGYDYKARLLRGFSQTRMSGVGCLGIGGNLLITPFMGVMCNDLKIDKSSEISQPGYYSVIVDSLLKIEVTAGRTTAFYRFTYPKTDISGIKIDFKHSYGKHVAEEHNVVNDNAIEGFVKSACTCDLGCYKFYYYIEKDKPASMSEGDDSELFWRFSTDCNEQITLKIGLSSVSVEEARLNLKRESSNLSFEKVRANAYACWEDLLNEIYVESNDEDLKTSFYTRFYHACQTPFNINDYSGSYRGSDGELYKTSQTPYYHGWSMWDTYRTKYPLLSIVCPQEYGEMINSLVRLYDQGKPRSATLTEPFLTTRTEHSIITILDAVRKGVSNVPLNKLLPLMLKEAESASNDSPDKILEGAYDFWGISELAEIAGNRDLKNKFALLSQGYRSIWLQKFKNIGSTSDIMHGDGLYEGTIWQYRWFVPHDFDWIVSTLGGKEKILDELNYFFENNLFNMGNQPDIHVPFLYYYLGEPWRTQKLINQILLEPTVNYYGTHEKWEKPYVGKVFTTTPQGYLKEMDDDAGTMSSWYVLSSIGLFPVCPGVPYYWILPPIFDMVTIHPASLHKFKISVSKRNEKCVYIQRAILNGEILNRSWLGFDEIMRGGDLILELGESPNKNWGCNTDFIKLLFEK